MEGLPELIAPSAQRTARLNALLRGLALAFGGEAGVRQRVRRAMQASGDPLLRRAHSAVPPVRPTPRVLGFDDFSFRKGPVFGTILPDGERHKVVDLLSDRTAETASAWLQQTASAADKMQPLPQPLPHPPPTTERSVQASPAQQRRLAQYQEVIALAVEGLGSKVIAQRVGLTRQTVAIWLRTGCFPERSPSSQLVLAFLQLVRKRAVVSLEPWIATVRASGLPERVQFAKGLVRDRAAVEAALRYKWSNGRTEGHVNRLKMIKRTAYGRASFTLLRQRVLAQV